MADAFLGLRVFVLLKTGIKIEGTVSSIEPSTSQMTLKEVTLYFVGQPPHKTPVYGVIGSDIKDLQVLEIKEKAKTLDHHVLENAPPTYASDKILTPTKSISKNRKPKQQPSPFIKNKKYNNTNNNYNNNVSSWAGEDVNTLVEDFDFQKNLEMFDKAKEFAIIRETDETAPEELLVTLNRLPPKKINLLPTENVLDHEGTMYEDDLGDESDNDSQTPDEYSKRTKPNQPKEQHYTTRIITVNDGILCPTVSPLQMAHAEHECTNISNSFEELWIENGGRGTAVLSLQVLSKMDVVSPSVVILVGNNKNGGLGLVAARHLMNHGCLVTVCLPIKEDFCDYLVTYESMARHFGVSVCRDTSELGETDLVIDAILGIDDKLIDIQDPEAYNMICNTIDWANNQPKPVLSIDFPSGIDASTGIPHDPEHIIHPKWTLCLGAPKTGCKSTHITGELYLLDVGIPRLCWKRIGVKGNTIPWGADFLVALEYDVIA